MNVILNGQFYDYFYLQPNCDMISEDTCCSNSDFQRSSILSPAFFFLARHVIRVLESSGRERSGEVWDAVWTQTRARAVLVSWFQ